MKKLYFDQYMDLQIQREVIHQIHQEIKQWQKDIRLLQNMMIMSSYWKLIPVQEMLRRW